MGKRSKYIYIIYLSVYIALSSYLTASLPLETMDSSGITIVLPLERKPQGDASHATWAVYSLDWLEIAKGTNWKTASSEFVGKLTSICHWLSFI